MDKKTSNSRPDAHHLPSAADIKKAIEYAESKLVLSTDDMDYEEMFTVSEEEQQFIRTVLYVLGHYKGAYNEQV